MKKSRQISGNSRLPFKIKMPVELKSQSNSENVFQYKCVLNNIINIITKYKDDLLL